MFRRNIAEVKAGDTFIGNGHIVRAACDACHNEPWTVCGLDGKAYFGRNIDANIIDAAFIEKEDTEGLTRSEIMNLLDVLDNEPVYPLEINDPDGNSTAMGFIRAASADIIDYRYANESDFGKSISAILADMNLESENEEYSICNLKVYITRNCFSKETI